MAASDDPDYAWVRQTWREQDPRVPLLKIFPSMGGTDEHSTPDDGAGAGRVSQEPVRRARRPGATRSSPACFGIFGHGNVAGSGQALQQNPDFRYYPAATSRRVHIAAAFAKMSNRLRPSPARPRSARARPTWSPARPPPPSTACRCCCCRATSSRAATWRRCCSNSRVRAQPGHLGQRLLQAGLALLGSHQPARAASLCAAGGDARADLARPRPARSRWRCRRTCRPKRSTTPRSCSRSASGTSRASPPTARRWRAPSSGSQAARRPLIIAGGGVLYSEATEALARFAAATGIPVAETRPARARCPSTIRRTWAPSA